MPYTIKPVKGGYKVYTAKGKPLSKKPLPKVRARKQFIAVNLSEKLFK